MDASSHCGQRLQRHYRSMRRKVSNRFSFWEYIFGQSSQRYSNVLITGVTPRRLAVLIVVAAALSMSNGRLFAKTADFPDPNLAACVVEAMKAEGVATPRDLTRLSCNARKIETATGIETLSSLVELSLFGNRLATINLNNLPHLATLNLADNLLRKVDVSQNAELLKLYLFRNRLTTLDLGRASKLQKLRAENNRLEVVTFGQMPALKKVYLFDNRMEDINIDNLTGLRSIDVRANPMPDEIYDYLDSFSGVKASHDGNTEEWR